jgi:hypothetical protein
MHRVMGMSSTGCKEGILNKDVACGILVRVVDVVPVERHIHRTIIVPSRLRHRFAARFPPRRIAVNRRYELG